MTLQRRHFLTGALAAIAASSSASATSLMFASTPKTVSEQITQRLHRGEHIQNEVFYIDEPVVIESVDLARISNCKFIATQNWKQRDRLSVINFPNCRNITLTGNYFDCRDIPRTSGSHTVSLFQ